MALLRKEQKKAPKKCYEARISGFSVCPHYVVHGYLFRQKLTSNDSA